VKNREVPALGPALGKEGVALLPAHGPDLLHTLGGRELVRAIRRAAFQLERRVGLDDAVVDGIGEHDRQRDSCAPSPLLFRHGDVEPRTCVVTQVTFTVYGSGERLAERSERRGETLLNTSTQADIPGCPREM